MTRSTYENYLVHINDTHAVVLCLCFSLVLYWYLPVSRLKWTNQHFTSSSLIDGAFRAFVPGADGLPTELNNATTLIPPSWEEGQELWLHHGMARLFPQSILFLLVSIAESAAYHITLTVSLFSDKLWKLTFFLHVTEFVCRSMKV